MISKWRSQGSGPGRRVKLSRVKLSVISTQREFKAVNVDVIMWRE